MKQLLIEFTAACAITWALVFALGLSGCTFMDQATAFTAINGQQGIQIQKSVRMPASLEMGVRS